MQSSNLGDGENHVKDNLFSSLESYFSHQENDSRAQRLYDIFLRAKESGSDENYRILIEELYCSSLIFPDFIVQCHPRILGDVYEVRFLKKGEVNDSAKRQYPSKKEEKKKSGSSTLAIHESYYKHIQEIRKEILTERNLREELEHQLRELNLDTRKRVLDCNEEVRYESFKGKSVSTQRDQECEDRMKFEPIQDTSSCIMRNPTSRAALFGWIIFGLQVTMFTLFTIVDVENERSGTVPLVPKGVPSPVHGGQTVAILLIAVVQDGFWESILHIVNGFDSHLESQGVTFHWWLITNIMRLSEGLYASAVTFILVINSDNNTDLFKDFTAMTFVSSFDNIVYQLAKMNALGLRMKKATDKVEALEIRRNLFRFPVDKSYRVHSKFLYLIRPLAVVVYLLIAMYTIWFVFCFYPQITGALVCQKVHFQFNDNIEPSLAYFSGTYEYQKNFNLMSYSTTYKESKSSASDNGRTPLQLQSVGAQWVFTLNGITIIESSAVRDEALFDIMEVGDDWSVGEQLGGIPLVVRMDCVDGDSDENDDEGDKCNDILIDERYSSFVSTKEWSRDFKLAENTQVYDKNVYWAHANDMQSFDLIFFTGMRWVLVSSTTFNSPVKETTNITEVIEHLKERFHGHWSKYEPDFFSKQILHDTPEDNENPLNVQWYSALTKYSSWSNRSVRTVDEKTLISATLICRYCNNTTMPCFFENKCSASTQTCQCENGANGTLCQIAPISNGQCDPHFNTLEYDYDGGDCCRSTCKNVGSSYCGFYNSLAPWYAYVGFDMCKRNSEWEQSSSIDNDLSSITELSASISENSRKMVAIDKSNGNIFVYDITGTEIRKRDTLQMSDFGQVSELQISSFQNTYPAFDDFDPVTIAVSNGHNIQIRDYARQPTGWKSHQPHTGGTSLIKKMWLRKNGNALGLLFENKTMVLFERKHYSMNFIKRENFSNIESFFLSSQGDRVILLGNKKAEIKFLSTGKSITINGTDEYDSEKTTVSPDGNHILFLTVSSGKFFKYTYSQREREYILKSEKRVQNFAGDTFFIHNSGNITIHSKNRRYLRHFESQTQINIEAHSIQFADDESFFMAIGDKLMSGIGNNGVRFWHRHLPPTVGTSIFRISFSLEKPQEFRWDLFRFHSNDNIELLKGGGPYNLSYINYDESVSIEANSCIGIKIYDLGLDGLKLESENAIDEPEGYVFISENSTILWTTNSTNGFLNVSMVKTHGSCKTEFEKYVNNYRSFRPYEETLHETCLSKTCKWDVSGTLDRGSIPKIATDFGVSISVSSDGSVVAVSNYVQNKVMIYKYNNNTTPWVEYGEPLTGTPTVNDEFGYCVSLSANGETIAIASPKANNINQAWFGQVQIFEYRKDRWKPRVTNVNKRESTERIGEHFSVSISADGMVLAVGARFYQNKDAVCLAKVFRYKNSRWTQKGQCLSDNTYGALKVRLTSIGTVVAVNNVFQPYRDRFVGEVTVLAYNENEDKWIQRGRSFQGVQDSQQLGNSMSLSSDGTVIALGGNIDVPSRVYNYNFTTGIWDQRGQAIPALAQGIYYAVSLSASGNVWVIAQVNTIRVYIFDLEAKEWILSNSKNKNDADIFRVNPFEWAVVTTSADATTIVNKFETEKVEIKRLVPENEENCNDDNALFEFTIQPDMFPQDILWFLEDQKGSRILGGKRLSDNENKTFSSCLATGNDALYTLNIIDVIGDGICCSNGDGQFNLTWNTTKRTFGKNDGIEKFHRGTVCLPFETNSEISRIDAAESFYVPSKSSSLFSLDFVNPGVDVTWSIFKTDGLLLSTGSASDQPIVRRCLPVDECFIFRVHSWSGNGSEFTLSVDGTMVHNNTGSNEFIFNGKNIGNCSSNQNEQQTVLFGLDLGTDNALSVNPSTFYWKVFLSDLSDKPFFESRSKIEESMNNLYHGSKDGAYNEKDCLYVRLFDVPGQAKKQYGAWVNDSLVKQGNHDGLLTTFYNGAECSTNQCPPNQVHFSLDILTGDDVSQFNWKLLLGSDVISNSTEQYIENDYYYFYQQCVTVPSDECMTLKLSDTINIPQTYFAVMWDGTLVKENQQIENEEEIMWGNCNKTAVCGNSNQSLFSIIFRFDDSASFSESVQWTLTKKDYGSTLEEGKNYEENKKIIIDEKCINATSADCLSFHVEVKTYGLNVKYSLSLDGNLVKSQILYLQQEIIYFGNC